MTPICPIPNFLEVIDWPFFLAYITPAFILGLAFLFGSCFLAMKKREHR